MKCWNEAEFDHTTDNIVRSVMIYPLNAWAVVWMCQLYIHMPEGIDILIYQITFDLHLKIALFPLKYFLSTTLVHKKYILYPT